MWRTGLGQLVQALWVLALAGVFGAVANATSVETLLMPGKVSSAHVKQEETCSNCHDRSNRRTQSALCLDCHKEVAADVLGKHGYHGRMANVSSGECRACHTEHKGREEDIVKLNRAQFDHRQTQFALEGAHRSLSCASCHKGKEPFRKAPDACIGCHKNDDVHKGQFTQSCDQCHGSFSWSGGKFDHDKTDFKLTGAHTGTTCAACHVGGHYKQTPKSCNGCHATDDEHRGSRGEDCGKCHVTQDWRRAKYDHLKETGYELLGVHSQADCISCHRSGNYKEKIPKDCNGCHQADDAHAGRFGIKCADCHDNQKWPLDSYDHLGKHKYALEGAHAKISCYACHTAQVSAQKLPTDCASCHRSQDPHGGKLKGGCENCHGQASFRSGVVFDHDLTNFPLVGLHRVVSCAQCHRTLAFTGAQSKCIDCHAQDDVHKDGLGKKCESCHSTNGWALWEFDHGKQAHFKLLGAHSKLKCADCHRVPPGTDKMSQQCVSCHRKDDRHLGQFGAQCGRCHTNDSWKGARIQ
jgi:hypothetical protein